MEDRKILTEFNLSVTGDFNKTQFGGKMRIETRLEGLRDKECKMETNIVKRRYKM